MVGIAQEIRVWKVVCGSCAASDEFPSLKVARDAGWKIEWPNISERADVRCPAHNK